MPEQERPAWTMPEWMEPYRELISDTGGNPVEELVNDQSTTAQSNLIRAALIMAVTSQVWMLQRLHDRGMLARIPAEPRSPRRCEVRATKGTGAGICDRLLDDRGQCDRASSHIDV